MKRKNRRFWILAAVAMVMATVLILAAGTAGAEDGRKLKISMPAPRRMTRGASFEGPDSAETCVKNTWRISKAGFVEAGYWYEYTMTINDGSHEDGSYDTMYVAPRTTGASFSYTFYQPGQYCLFAEKYTAEKGGACVDSIYQMITVTEGNGNNPLKNAVATAARACRGENDFRTVEKINDYLCEKIDYDYTYTYYSPEDALLKGKGVCNGYSRSFELIATECGLECRRVAGELQDKEGGHVWNLVKMDGEWYHIDPTWNDTTGIRHLYFGLTDKLIGFDHMEQFIIGGDAIVCSAMNDNWYIYTGEWDTILARSTRGAIETSIAGGATKIEQRLDKIHVNATSENYYQKSGHFWVYGNILAYGYSQEIWKGPKGIKVKGPFTYNFTKSVLTATLGPATEPGTLYLPADLKKIEANAFEGIDAKKVIIPDGCTVIGDGAFRDCTNLKFVSYKKGTEIGEGAFEGCAEGLQFEER